MAKSVETVAQNTGLNPCCNGMKIELTGYVRFEKTTLLNPCCNGMKIECGFQTSMQSARRCLNPCCNGMKIE